MVRYIIDVHEKRRIPIVMVEHDMVVVMDIAQDSSPRFWKEDS